MTIYHHLPCSYIVRCMAHRSIKNAVIAPFLEEDEWDCGVLPYERLVRALHSLGVRLTHDEVSQWSVVGQ